MIMSLFFSQRCREPKKREQGYFLLACYADRNCDIQQSSSLKYEEPVKDKILSRS